MAIKLLSLNVEQDKHLELVKPFIEQEKADVVALMEVGEDDLDLLLPEYPHRIYMPNFYMPSGKKIGVVIASKTELTEAGYFYGDGREGTEIPPHGKGTHRPLMVSVTTNGIKLGVVHWTWTEGGYVSPQQVADFERLLNHLGEQEIVLCGDFNLPRNLPGGNPIYEQLAKKYKDNVPPGIMSTVDPHLHRVNMDNPGKLAWMVDYIWTTPAYIVQDLQVKCGVSDHCGLIAGISLI